MKRKTKILLTVLSVLLISGTMLSMLFASAADVSGVTVKSTQSFETISDDWFYTASDGTNPKVGNVTFQQGGRAGVLTAGNSLPYEKNKYVIITQDDKAGTAGPYVWASVGTRPTTETLNNTATDMKNYSYYSFDIDVMAPSGKFINAAFDFSTRYVTSSGSVDFWRNSALNSVVMFGNDSNGSYIYLNGAASNKKYIDPYEFTHITCIIEPVVTSSSYKANTYVYVNGEYFSYKSGTTGTTSYYNSTPHASLIEYRITYTTAEDPTLTFAIDNPTFRTYDKSYNGNLSTVLSQKTTLDAWESNVYDESTMPAGKFVAYNETTRVRYDSLSEAVAAAKAGETVHVVCDTDEAITLDKEISISTAKGNGEFFSVNLTAADGYSLVPTLDGVYSCEKTVEKLYEYVSGGVTKTADRSKTVAEIIALADSGTTVKLFDSVYHDASSAIGLSKNITLDLGGNLLVFKQPNKVCFLNVNGKYSFTLKNGVLVAEYDDPAKESVGYPAFGLSSNATLNIDNVDTYTPSIVWSYGGNNSVVNINGGNHYQQSRAADVSGGFFESRANTTFTATDATFYLGSGANGLFSSLHYRTPSNVTKKSTFTYNNCNIYSTTPAQELVPWSNEFTEVYFNGCDIMGSIHPSIHQWEISQPAVAHGPAKDGSIVIGAGCRVAQGASFSGAVCMADGQMLKEANYNETVVLHPKSGSLATGDFAITENSFGVCFAYEAVPATTHTVIWYAADGKSIIKKQTVATGATVTPPTYDSVMSNGWFSASYDGWSHTLGGDKTANFKIVKDAAFYPAISGDITPDLSAAGYNLSLLGSVKINLYLPTPPEGFTFNGVYDKNGNEIFSDKVILAGQRHLRYVLGEVGATSLATSVSATVKFTVNGTVYEKALSLSPYKYASTLLSDSASENRIYPEKAYTLVADMVRYSNNLVKFIKYAQTGTASGNVYLTSLLNKYSGFCTTLPNNFSDLSEVNMTPLTGYVSSFSFEVSSYQPSYKFTFASNSKIVDCYVKMDGYYSNIINGANYGEVTYKSDNKTYFDGTKYLSSVYITDVPMYNIDNTIEICVLLDNGTVKSGTYNLNGYYNQVSIADEAQDTLLRDFIKSLRAFGESAVEYRFDTVVIPESEAMNFRKCEHPKTEEITFALSDGILPMTAKARYCNTCKNYLIYYSDYGAVGDGSSNGRNADGSTNMTGNITVSGTNDFAAIRAAHVAANAIAERFPEKNIVVIGKGLVGNSFYMGYPDDGGAQAIKIKTDVNWDGVHFIIDDTTVHNKDGTRAAYKQAIFSVIGDESMRGVGVTDNIPDGIAKGATNIGYAPGRPLMIKLTLKSVRHYIRYGANVNSGSEQSEMIIVDAYGNIDHSTPVQWDYTNRDYCSTNIDKTLSNSWVVTACTPVDANGDGKCDTCGTTITKAFSAVAYAADDKPITVSGLDKNGNINCIWESITSDKVDVSGYDQAQRNINVNRSNVTFQGIDRVFVEDNSAYTGSGSTGTPRQTYAAYINVSNAYNIVIKDMKIDYHLGHKDAKGITLGSYEFGGGSSINISWINCIQKDFFRYASDGNYIRYGGMFGSNFLRNVYINGCVMSSFDAHSGLYNATIENSTFDHVNFVGGGDAIMRNVVVYAEANAGACHLRSDYGSMWQGNIILDGVTLRHDSNYSGNIEVIKAYYTNHYFGFDTELPGNVYINNFSVKQYNRTSEAYTHNNGIVYEDEVTSSKSVHLFYTLNSQMKNDYDYSTVNANNKDPKTCTKNIYITNTDTKIIYPNHFFFEDMKVYVDGVEQNWFTLRSGLHSHKDANGDKSCDTCGKYRG